MTKEEKREVIAWLQALSSSDQGILNPMLENLMVAVDPLSGPPQNPPTFALIDLARRLNDIDKWKDLEEISETVELITNSLVIVGVRGDKAKRPLKS